MKVEFRFNGTAQIVLTPENSKEKQLLSLATEGCKAPTLLVDENRTTIFQMESVELCL